MKIGGSRTFDIENTYPSLLDRYFNRKMARGIVRWGEVIQRDCRDNPINF